MPIHKVDDITHINFTDRDHLWFDPNSNGNCKNSNSNSGSSSSNNNNDSREREDPMAAMLENNAKNPKVILKDVILNNGKGLE